MQNRTGTLRELLARTWDNETHFIVAFVSWCKAQQKHADRMGRAFPGDYLQADTIAHVLFEYLAIEYEQVAQTRIQELRTKSEHIVGAWIE